MIIYAAKYDTQTGLYTWAGTCDENDPLLEGEGVYRGVVDPTAQYHDLATNQPVRFPPRPNYGYVWDSNAKQWTPSAERMEMVVRQRRGELLAESDWTDTASAPARMGQTLYEAWQQYRQALRDIPDQAGFPLTVVWPTKPQ